MREMKDSGIEWIGTIPFDWKCCKQKYEIQLINGRAYSDSEFEEDGKYRILRVGNLFSNPTWYTSSLELPPDKYCENGDLLYSWSMSYVQRGRGVRPGYPGGQDLRAIGIFLQKVQGHH